MQQALKIWCGQMNMKEAANRTRGGLMAAWWELVPVAANAGVRYMPYAMVLLDKTHSPMAGTRASGELLAGGAVCQRIRSSNSSSTFAAA
jgi:hypothetical protein